MYTRFPISGVVSVAPDREPRTIRVDSDVFEAFEEQAAEYGLSKAEAIENALSEWTDTDRLARIEAKLDALPDEVVDALSEEGLERERRKPSPASPGTTMSRTEQRARQIAADLPPHTTISETMVDATIEEHAGSSFKTLKKYKQSLQRMGKLFPSPTGDEYYTSAKQFALALETDQSLTNDDVDELIGDYEEFLGEDWFFEALPDDYIQGQELRLEKAGRLSADAYRRENGLHDDRRGVQ